MLLQRFRYYPPVLMYHTLDQRYAQKATYVSFSLFCRQMDFISERGFDVMRPDDFVRSFSENNLKRKQIAVTFDDGYKDNLKAVDLLAKKNIPAVIFVITDWLGREGYLTEDDLLYIRKNTPVIIGSHTLTHDYLPERDPRVRQKTIIESKHFLENLLGEEIVLFSYPIGGYNKNIVTEVKNAGYEGAFATNRGKGADEFCVKRINVNNRDKTIKFAYKLSGYYWAGRKFKSEC